VTPEFAGESAARGDSLPDAGSMKHVEAYGGTLLARILAAGATLSLHILIARSVTPAEYGAVAFLVTTLAILLLLVSFGNEALLIREGGVRSSRALSVSVFAPGFAVLLAAACVIAAGSLERLLTIPGLGRLLLFGLPVLPLQAMQILPRAELLRRQEFLSLARIDASSNVLAWIPAVGMYMLTGDLAAFAVYLLAMHSLRAVMYWRRSHVDRGSFHGQSLRIGTYLSGWRIMSIESSTFLTTTFDDLMVAANLGAAMLGVYHLAYRIISVTQDFFAGVMRVLSYPRYTVSAPDRGKVYRQFCADTRFVTAIVLPILTTALVTADAFFPLLLGKAWADGVFVFQLLTLEAMRQSLLSLGAQALVALGDERRLLRYSLVSATVLLPSFVLLSLTDLRIFAIGFVAVNTALNAYFYVIIRRSFAPRLRPLLLAWTPGLLASLFPLLISAGLRIAGSTSPAAVLGGGAAGLLLAAAFYPLVAPDVVRSLRLAAGLKRRDRESAAHSRVIVYVDGPFDEENPHLQRVYGVLQKGSPGIELRRLHFRRCLAEGWKRKIHPAADAPVQVVHMHYPAYLYEGKTLPGAVMHGVRNAALLLALRVAGYRFVLTLHDSGAHDYPWRRWERCCLTALVQCADLTATLSEEGGRQLFDTFGRAQGVRIARHCLYPGDGGSAERRDTVRAEFGIAANETVFLLYGSVKPYKGYDRFVRVCSGLGNQAPTLLCAGRGMTRLAADAERAGLRAIAVDRFISEEETAGFMDAADFGALPYERILHSGTAMLYASHACPVIAPRIGVFIEHERDYGVGMYYDPGSDEDLRRVIRDASARGREAFAGAFDVFFSDHRPEDEAAALLALYREVSGKEILP